ncbi:MAG: ClbS/DfsB family four-helix bundle protein [Anaerolineales bacterium]
MNRQALQKELNESREELRALIDELPEEAFHEPGVMNGWSLKDILAHLNRWEGLLVTMLWKLKQGKPAERTDIQGEQAVDRLNAKWHEEDKDRSLDLILADLHGLRKQTIRRLEEFSQEELTEPDQFEGLRGEPLWKWIAVDTFEHEREHLPAIREWILKRKE